MMPSGWTIVLDVGKTFSKASLWDEGARCVAVRSRPNQSASAPYPALDAAGIEHWLRAVLADYARLGPVRSIVPVAHGAAATLIRQGRLSCAPIDYEWPGVELDRIAYLEQRDAFDLTGSPALPAGLNLGMQLHWLDGQQPAGNASAQILPWAQYWAWLLCATAASEVSSLGCHTDLWRPFERAPSALALRRGWAGRLAPLRHAGEVLGTLSSEWTCTGLPSSVQILCGLHDSNAAFLAARKLRELQGRDATLLSTGTWFVAMRAPAHGARAVPLPQARDCLINVDVSGGPIPSGRFMGGREIELLIGAMPHADAARALLLERAIRCVELGAMIMPTAVTGVGPFPQAKPSWLPARGDDTDALVRAHLYAALLADATLDLIGSTDTLLIEGRFSRAPVFTRALAALRPATRVFISSEDNGVSRGALCLIDAGACDNVELERVCPLPIDLVSYRNAWRERLAA